MNLSFTNVTIESNILTGTSGTNAIINIYISKSKENVTECVWIWTNENVKPKNRQNKLSNLDIEPFYKCKNKNEDACSICLNKIETNEYIRKLKCNHLFHKKCVDKWLKKNQNCPMCRKTIEIK